MGALEVLESGGGDGSGGYDLSQAWGSVSGSRVEDRGRERTLCSRQKTRARI